MTEDQASSNAPYPKGRLLALTAVYLASVGLLAYVTLSTTPRYEKFYEEMLGDRSTLPQPIVLVVQVGRLIQQNVLFIAPALLLLVPLSLWKLRTNRVAILCVQILTFLMLAFCFFAIHELPLPAMKVIEEINSRS